jgi:hypothetical protein
MVEGSGLTGSEFKVQGLWVGAERRRKAKGKKVD